MHALRQWFSKRIGYPFFVLGRSRRDRKMRALMDEKRQLSKLPREQLYARQLELLKPILIHAGRTVPFYRQRFKDVGFEPESVERLEDLAKIPPLTKDDIRENLDKLVSTTQDRSKLDQLVTGGSTGIPTRLYCTKENRTHREASALLADEFTGWHIGEPFAALWGAFLDVTDTEDLLGKLRKLARNILMLNTYRVDDRLLADYHRQLSKFRPTALLGYNSSLLFMADWLEANGISPQYPSTCIINTSETLLPWHRERFETIYGAPVFDRYASRDCGVMAMECEAHAGLHMNIIDWVIEPYGATHGEPQELLLTSLNERGMPLIRYAVGDMAVFTDRTCPCGRTSPLFERIVGRVSDAIYLPGGARITDMFFPQVFKDFPVAEFQVIQEEDYSFTVRIVAQEAYRPEHEQHIRERFAGYVGELPVRFEYVAQIDRTRTGKLRPVISKATQAAQSDTDKNHG